MPKFIANAPELDLISTSDTIPMISLRQEGLADAIQLRNEAGQIVWSANANGAGFGAHVIFDQTLANTGPSIDTGANGIPPGYAYIEVFITAATDFPGVAVTTTAGGIQVNGDGGANYYYESLLDGNGVYGGANNQATPDTGVLRINMPGATAGAGSICTASCVFHNYDNTNFNKNGILSHGMFDPVTAANGRMRVTNAYWKSTAAINQLSLLMKTNNLLAGSRMTIVGYK